MLTFQKLKQCFLLDCIMIRFWHHNILIHLMQSVAITSWCCVWFQIHGTTAVIARTNRLNTSRTLQQKLKSLPGKTALPQISTSGKDEIKKIIYGKLHEQIIKYCNCIVLYYCPWLRVYITELWTATLFLWKFFQCCEVHSTFALNFDECL